MDQTNTFKSLSLVACLVLTACGASETPQASSASKDVKTVTEASGSKSANTSSVNASAEALEISNSGDKWVSLFNGENLQGWQTFVSYQPKDSKYQDPDNLAVRGINNDPKHVFSVQRSGWTIAHIGRRMGRY